MGRKLIELGACIVALAMSAMAQTNVTNANNGTTNTVPVYTGTATLGNSPISVSGSNVGIGTTTPFSELHVIAGNANGVYAPPTAGNMSHGLIISNTLGGPAINEGVYANSNISLAYGWMQSAFVNNANVMIPLALNPVGGNVGIGTTAPGSKLEINGNVALTSGSGASLIFADGTKQTTAWTGAVCGGDYAESVDVTGDRKSFVPGDVLVVDTDVPGKFLKSNEPYATGVTGIYSTKPGTVGRRQKTPYSPDEVPMAMMGIVPVKATTENGAIGPGDLLVTSSKVGYAMKGTDRSRMLGAVIGKALGRLDSGTGVIEVVVTLQ